MVSGNPDQPGIFALGPQGGGIETPLRGVGPRPLRRIHSPARGRAAVFHPEGQDRGFRAPAGFRDDFDASLRRGGIGTPGGPFLRRDGVPHRARLRERDAGGVESGFLAMIRALAGCVLLALLPHAGAADLILKNGRIVTLDTALPRAEAMAITGGRITAIGTN